MEVNAKQAYTDIIQTINAGLVPMLKGSPGIGKSDIYRQIAKAANLYLIDIRLATADPTDMSGFPFVNEKTKKSYYAPPEMYPLIGDKIPTGYKGFMINFDEINSAALAVQAASYKVTLDKMIGQHKLHEKAVIVCAGNLATDMAIVNRMSTAMQSRLIHINLAVELAPWIEWAQKEGIDHRIISFLQFRPELLHKFDPKHKDDTFACPRTWYFLSKLIKKVSDIPNTSLPLMAGTVGEGAAIEFYTHTKIFATLPTIAQIESSPGLTAVPTEPSTLYAVSGIVSGHAEASNIDKLVMYTTRLPAEFQVITMQGIIRRCKALLKSIPVQDWITANHTQLIY